MLTPHFLTRAAVRRDGRCDRDDPIPRQQPRDEPDTPNIRVAIVLREPETAAQIGADFIAVKNLDPMAAVRKYGANAPGKRRLAGPREPGEPDRQPTPRPHVASGVYERRLNTAIAS